GGLEALVEGRARHFGALEAAVHKPPPHPGDNHEQQNKEAEVFDRPQKNGARFGHSSTPHRFRFERSAGLWEPDRIWNATSISDPAAKANRNTAFKPSSAELGCLMLGTSVQKYQQVTTTLRCSWSFADDHAARQPTSGLCLPAAL